jgi:death-on-curing protein
VTNYLRPDDALQVVNRYGFHVRDAGLLASALARPSASIFGTDAYASLDRKAAALLESLARNHTLVDGNKRIAWTLMVLFLWINGFRHDFATDVGFALVVGVADGSVDLDEAERQICEHRLPRERRTTRRTTDAG